MKLGIEIDILYIYILRIIAIYWDVLSMFKVCSNDTRGGISRIRLAAEKLGAASPIVFGNLSLSFLSI